MLRLQRLGGHQSHWVAELVQAYRVNRHQGGANQMTLPKSLGRWLCAGCLAVARGADVDQAELF